MASVPRSSENNDKCPAYFDSIFSYNKRQERKFQHNKQHRKTTVFSNTFVIDISRTVIREAFKRLLDFRLGQNHAKKNCRSIGNSIKSPVIPLLGKCKRRFLERKLLENGLDAKQVTMWNIKSPPLKLTRPL